MTEVQQKPALAGFFGTILVWLLIFLFFYFSAVLFAPKQYKTVKIRLDAPQKTESPKTENGKLKMENSEGESLPPASHSVAPTPPSPKGQNPLKSPEIAGYGSGTAFTETRSKSASVVEPVETTTKAQSAPAPAEQTLQKSMDELLAEQQARKPVQKKKSAEEMWAELEAQEGTSSSNTSAVAKNTVSSATNQNAFSGSAASSSDSASTAASAQSKSSRSAENQTASSATTQALQGALSAKAYSSSSNGISSSVTANTGSSSDGKVSLQMADGSPRVLLEPAEPKIVLSREAAALIDSTKRLTVSFTVLASGTVPVTSVKISPDILPSLVSMEIREQISRWRFQSASYDGSARFEYTIQKN